MVIKLRFELKFHLPIVSEQTFVSSWPDFATFKYPFLEIERNEPDSLIPKIFTTTIVIEYLSHLTGVNKIDYQINSAVLNCMIFLNNYIDAYRLANQLEYIKNFNISDLPPYLNIETEDAEILYTFPHFLTTNSPLVPSIEMAKLATEKFMLWRMYKPFEIIDKFHSKAVHHLYNEEYVLAIVELQTSFESYILLCHNLILRKCGFNDMEIEKKLAIPLKNTIEHHLAKGLKENLNFSTNPIILRWHTSLYKLRNQIVHSGLSYILGSDAHEAFQSYQSIINYLSDLMVREGLITSDKMIKVDNLNIQQIQEEEHDLIVAGLKKNGMLTFLDDINNKIDEDSA